MFDRVEELPVPWAAGRRSNGDSREAHARRGDLRPWPQVCLQSFYLSAQRKWTLLKGATPPVCPQESDRGPQDRPTARVASEGSCVERLQCRPRMLVFLHAQAVT